MALVAGQEDDRAAPRRVPHPLDPFSVDVDARVHLVDERLGDRLPARAACRGSGRYHELAQHPARLVLEQRLRLGVGRRASSRSTAWSLGLWRTSSRTRSVGFCAGLEHRAALAPPPCAGARTPSRRADRPVPSPAPSCARKSRRLCRVAGADHGVLVVGRGVAPRRAARRGSRPNRRACRRGRSRGAPAYASTPASPARAIRSRCVHRAPEAR